MKREFVLDDSAPEFNELLSLFHGLADASSRSILGYFRQNFAVEHKEGKGQFDPVTQADKEAESVIRQMILDVYPHHNVIGEEFGQTNSDSSYSWIIDPIDGTRAFIMGYPVWGTLIGLVHQNVPLIGMMSQPFTGERFWTDQKQTHYRWPDGEKQLSVRDCGSLKNALLSTTSPDFFAEGFETERFFAVKRNVKMCRYGGDCYAYCLLAGGHIDLIIEAGLSSYDILPLIPIIERAGGIVTSWTGEPVSDGGRVVAAGSKRVHEQALEILSGS